MSEQENWMREHLPESSIDVETVIRGTRQRIRRRSIVRKTGYGFASALSVLLVLIFTMRSGETPLPGLTGEGFLIASDIQWYEVDLGEEAGVEDSLYWNSMEYLATHDEWSELDADDALSEEDLNAFIAYLEEV